MADTRAHSYDRYQTGSLAGAAIRPRFDTDSRLGTGQTREETTMVQTVQKNIRLSPEQWERIEKAAEEREVSANQLLVELAIEALDRREWPRTAAEIYLLALRDVHRPGHGARHGGGRARRGDRRNRPQHLQSRPGTAARDGRKRVILEPQRGKIGRRHGRSCPNPGAATTTDPTT